MGFNGFFNYEKPGPGIKKDGPKKKMFFVFLETFFRNFWKLIPVSLLFSLMSIILIPSGLGYAGITNVTRNLARDKHSFGVSDFFSTIKKNFKQAIPAGIINLIVSSLLLFSMDFWFKSKGVISIIAFGLTVACFIVFSFMRFHFWLLLITFKLPLKNIYKNCFLFSFINIKANLLIVLFNLVSCVLVMLLFAVPNLMIWVIGGFIMVGILPGFTHLFAQFMIFPKVKKLMIDPYYEQHPDEDVELRRNLGLEITEETQTVFDDAAAHKKDDE